MRRSRIVPCISWSLAILLVGVGVALAAAIPGGGGTVALGGGATRERSAYVGIALVLAAIVLLLAHQRWGRMAVSSAVLLLASFAVRLRPAHTGAGYIRMQASGAVRPSHGPMAPRHPAPLFAIFLTAAIACAAIGFVREAAWDAR